MTVGNLRRATRGRAIGRLLSLIAVLLPIVVGPVVHAAMMRGAGSLDMPGMDMSGMAMPGGTPLCGMDMPGSQPAAPANAPGHHQEPDCAVCPLCAALAHPAIAWMPVAFAPRRVVVVTIRPERPRAARAPPVTELHVAYPRGPPASI